MSSSVRITESFTALLEDTILGGFSSDKTGISYNINLLTAATKIFQTEIRPSKPRFHVLEPTILDKTVGKVSTFEVFIASLLSPLLQCCAKLNGLSGKLLSYLPTLSRGEGGYVRESETISFEL